MCCTLWLSTPVPPKGVLEYPWSTPWVPNSGETHGRRRDLEIFHSAIRAPRSGRLLALYGALNVDEAPVL